MRLSLTLASIAVFASGCGEDPLPDGTGGQGPGTTSSLTSSTGTSTPPSSSSSGGSTCMTSAECTNSTFCEAPGDACPSAATPGTCVPAPTGCAGEPEVPTCACNGQVYVSACEANVRRRDVGSQVACVVPADPFACGVVLCGHGLEYCQKINGDPTCEALPAGCEQPAATCACLEPVFCVSAPDPGATKCSKDASGDFLVECVVTE